jgi:hypothetical protein
VALPDLAHVTIALGTGASGGTGGDMDTTAGTKGDDGLACKVLDFSNPTPSKACTM